MAFNKFQRYKVIIIKKPRSMYRRIYWLSDYKKGQLIDLPKWKVIWGLKRGVIKLCDDEHLKVLGIEIFKKYNLDPFSFSFGREKILDVLYQIEGNPKLMDRIK